MDERTEELRDLFVSMTDEDEVTESQEETRGSLADPEDVNARIDDPIAEMRDRYEFDEDWSAGELRSIVTGFFEGESDGTLADDLDASRRDVVRARLNLHLIRDRDTDAPFDFEAFRRRILADEQTKTSTLAEEFDVSPSTVRRYRRVVTAMDESRRANDRYYDEFASLLGDADITDSLTRGAQEDGLEEATDGMETDVSF